MASETRMQEIAEESLEVQKRIELLLVEILGAQNFTARTVDALWRSQQSVRVRTGG